ncbi:helix-turn-helix transcriptional regulator [Methylobacterium oxalidis]|uniref:HTH luxR-type domain-containing protein n=1 Tax=Methylobacterium oxalidis TaxID=944322 RepID=A0A512JD88_9HYPH|nr:helix-turn-helix transcriptional regulator [Methylobacterium oxalidis]GEP07922.1 hypothetical protein MOX02_59600 [Methylobacterium oxalidis]GJE33598.1 hypothetical protein LDDCCGHA_3799 [Methylobacterium oxalidis]GLS66138.1 hypothetical protein GCM10007888_45200 [Methylobacterium oxalidis]
MPLGKPLLDALDSMGYGGLVLDAAGQVIRINTAAAGILKAQINATRTDDELAWSRKALDQLLRAQNNALELDEDGWFAVPQDSARTSRPLIVRAVPVSNEAASGPHRVVMLIDLDVMPRPSAEVLKRIFNLTPSEARLAIEMACGKSPEEAAEMNQVSVSTVRKQLATVFSKTNTHRQAELVALLTRLAILP